MKLKELEPASKWDGSVTSDGALTHCATMPQISLLMFPCAFEGKHTLRTPQMYWEN